MVRNSSSRRIADPIGSNMWAWIEARPLLGLGTVYGARREGRREEVRGGRKSRHGWEVRQAIGAYHGVRMRWKSYDIQTRTCTYAISGATSISSAYLRRLASCIYTRLSKDMNMCIRVDRFFTHLHTVLYSKIDHKKTSIRELS